MRNRLKGYLQLCRPPNLPTAAADVLAGLAIAGFFVASETGSFIFPLEEKAILLVVASVLLYAGGVVLNDVFDVALDTVERPERPIPKGIVPLKHAAIFGFSLLLTGVGASFVAGTLHGVVALVLAGAILLYNKYSKHHGFWGPLNMGLCRGLNLLLGLVYFGSFLQTGYCIIPVIYIFAITRISQGEVYGNNKRSILLAGLLYVFVILLVILLHQKVTHLEPYYIYFLLLFSLAVYVPLIKAYRENGPKQIRNAVKAGVLSLILLDAALAVAHSSWIVGVLIVLLLPLSIILSRMFAVT